MQGRLIGINTAIYSKTGTYAGVGFAIPANMVKVILTAARRAAGGWCGPGSGPACSR